MDPDQMASSDLQCFLKKRINPCSVGQGFIRVES